MKKIKIPFKKIKSSGFVFIGVAVFCLMFFSFKQVKDVWTAPADAQKKKNPIVSDEKSIAVGKDIFTKNCVSCHGKKGKGDGPKSADLDKSPGDFSKGDATKESDGALFWKISEGKKPMPSFKKELTEEQRWSVINYIRTFGPAKVVTPPKTDTTKIRPPKIDTAKTKPSKTDTTKIRIPKIDTTKTKLVTIDSIKAVPTKVDTVKKENHITIPPKTDSTKTTPPKVDSTKSVPPKTEETKTASCGQKKCCKRKSKKNKG